MNGYAEVLMWILVPATLAMLAWVVGTLAVDAYESIGTRSRRAVRPARTSVQLPPAVDPDLQIALSLANLTDEEYAAKLDEIRHTPSTETSGEVDRLPVTVGAMLPDRWVQDPKFSAEVNAYIMDCLFENTYRNRGQDEAVTLPYLPRTGDEMKLLWRIVATEQGMGEGDRRWYRSLRTQTANYPLPPMFGVEARQVLVVKNLLPGWAWPEKQGLNEFFTIAVDGDRIVVDSNQRDDQVPGLNEGEKDYLFNTAEGRIVVDDLKRRFRNEVRNHEAQVNSDIAAAKEAARNAACAQILTQVQR